VLRPGQLQVLPVVFQPRRRAAFATSLFVRWARAGLARHALDDAEEAAAAHFGGASRRVRVMGTGDSPSLEVQGWPVGGLTEFGAVKPGGIARKSIVLRSNCSFPVEYALEPASELPCSSFTSMGPFRFSTLSGTVPPGGSQTITARFVPDEARVDQQLPIEAAYRLVVKHADQPPRLWRL